MGTVQRGLQEAMSSITASWACSPLPGHFKTMSQQRELTCLVILATSRPTEQEVSPKTLPRVPAVKLRPPRT